MTDIAPRSTTEHATSTRTLARNSVLNLLGVCVPTLAALLAIPPLTKGLGTARFGLLALGWMVIRYFGLFDLGVGRALTQLVAEKLGTDNAPDISELVWTALALMLLLGSGGALILSSVSPWLACSALRIPASLRSEVLAALYLLAYAIPVVICSSGLRSVLEAKLHFDLVNVVHILVGTFSFVGPLLVLPFSSSLTYTVTVLVIGRFLACLAYLLLCLHTMPELRLGFVLKPAAVLPLLRFGGWVTVTNVISPLMAYMDRVLTSALTSATAVAYYATPQEVVTKLSAIPGALTNALFPAFSATSTQGHACASVLLDRGVRYVFLAVFPATLLMSALAFEILDLWVGPEFAQNGAGVLRLLAIGALANSLARVGFTFLQGTGRADLTGKVHLVELPFYLLAVWWLTSQHGIVGAAAAWTIRMVVDALLMLGITRQLMPASTPTMRRAVLYMGGALPLMAFFGLPLGVAWKAILLLLALVVFVLLSWFLLLMPREREWVRDMISRGQPPLIQIDDTADS